MPCVRSTRWSVFRLGGRSKLAVVLFGSTEVTGRCCLDADPDSGNGCSAYSDIVQSQVETRHVFLDTSAHAPNSLEEIAGWMTRVACVPWWRGTCGVC